MKPIRRTLTVLIALLILLTAPAVVVAATTDSSATTGGTLTITKLEGTQAETDWATADSSGNNGTSQSTTGKSPIAGVTFTVYDTNIATSSYTGMASSGTAPASGQVPDIEETIDPAALGWTEVQSKITNSDGQAVFNLTANDVYYVVEKENAAVEYQSRPFYFMLPFTYPESAGTSLAGTQTNNIFVYPKNVIAANQFVMTKTTPGNSDSSKAQVYGAGQEVTWTVSYTMPQTSTLLKSFSITDTQSVNTTNTDTQVAIAGLGAPSVTAVTFGGTTLPSSDYTIQAISTGGFTFTLTDAGISAVKNGYSSTSGADNNLIITYTSALPATATSSETYTNTASAAYLDNVMTTPVTTSAASAVTTADVTAIKYDGAVPSGADTGTFLAGAQFELFSKSSSGTLTPVSLANSQEAIQTTTASGTLNWTGLPAGDYVLKEIQAPAGYVLSNVAYTFTVPSTVAMTDSLAGSNNFSNSWANYKTAGFLPLFGSSGTWILIAAGAASVAVYFIMSKRSKTQTR